MQKQRIWELDALRGLCILCVIVVHFLFDLQFFIGLDFTLPAWFQFIQQYGGILFVVLSGCCATLGSRSFRRGLIVFGAGMLISLVTAGMYGLGLSDRTVIVWFGVLHLLGICMMVYPLFRKLPTAPLAALALCIILIGYAITGLRVSAPFLFPFAHCLCRKAHAPARKRAEFFPAPLFLLVRPPVPVHLPAPPAHFVWPARTARRPELLTPVRRNTDFFKKQDGNSSTLFFR